MSTAKPASELHYEHFVGTLLRREGLLSWRCPKCERSGTSKTVLKKCPLCRGLSKLRARRLTTIAKAINAVAGPYRATARASYLSTDRKPRGFRYITHKGKGRRGVEITIYDRRGRVAFTHDSSETYRTNSEVERWVCRHVPDAALGRAEDWMRKTLNDAAEVKGVKR